MKMARKSKNNYIDNVRFTKEMTEHNNKCKEAEEAGLPPPKLSDYIGKCFYDIAYHMSFMPSFINYSFKSEMISDGLENCLLYYRNFNENTISKRTGKKSAGAFTYFSQIIYYAFLRRILHEKEEQYVKYKTMQQTGVLDNLSAEDVEAFGINKSKMYDNMHRFIADFEEKLEQKKNKKAIEAAGKEKPVKKSSKKPKGLDNFLDNPE